MRAQSTPVPMVPSVYHSPILAQNTCVNVPTVSADDSVLNVSYFELDCKELKLIRCVLEGKKLEF